MRPCGCRADCEHSPGCTFAAERRRVAAEQEHPRLRVFHHPYALVLWCWELTGPQGETLDSGAAQTHAEALAVGLAALEVASLTRQEA